MKIALIHDALVAKGGAERVVASWLSYWPEATLYTSAYLPEDTYEDFKSYNIKTSWMQKVAKSPHQVMRYIFPLMIPAFRSFNFSEYDMVLSSASYAAKSIKVPKRTCHICYCHYPMRIAWQTDHYYNNKSSLKKIGLITLSKILQLIDYKHSLGVDYFITNSNNTAKYIKKYYKRESTVFYPPIDTSKFYYNKPLEDYYLVVSRLNNYKRVDLAINAAKELNKKLIIIGDGPDKLSLEKLAYGNKNIIFYGSVDEKTLLELYSKCRALIFPQEEDFGLTPLEAQASGKAVIAFAKGGVLETVINGKTGILFKEQNVNNLVKAILSFELTNFNPKDIIKHASKFDIINFQQKIAKFLEEKLAEYKTLNNIA